MRRLVIVVVCLLALFTLINAYTREANATSQEQHELQEADTAVMTGHYSFVSI